MAFLVKNGERLLYFLKVETACEEVVTADLQVALAVAGELHEPAEGEVAAEQLRIADEQEVLLGARHGDVQFAVDDVAVAIDEDVVGEEAQLVVAADGEAVDDVAALAALEALDGVDGDVV